MIPPSRLRHPRTAVRWAIPSALLSLLLVSGCGILDPDEGSGREPEEGETTVLFMGSSYLEFNQVPDRFREFSEKAGNPVFVGYYLFPGQPLSFFAQDLGAKTAIQGREWDFVVLQGGAASAAYPSTASTSDYLALKELHRLATSLSPQTRVVYMMPWAYEDGMTWVAGRTEDYEEMQLDILEQTLDWAHDLDLILAPVGMAWYEVLTTWPHGEHFLHDDDYNHASRMGSYLTAATFFSTIWLQDGTDVEYNWVIDGDTARALRGVAAATVLGDLEGWNISG